MLGPTSQIIIMKFLLPEKIHWAVDLQKLHMFNWLQQKYLQLSQSEMIKSQQGQYPWPQQITQYLKFWK